VQNNPPVFQLLIALWQHITPRRKKQFVLLLILTLVSSFAEVISLSAVLPFIGIITQPEKVFYAPSLAIVVKGFGIKSASELVFPLTIGFAGAALFSGGLRLLMLWVSLKLGNIIGADLGIEVYRRSLYQPYSVHVGRSSSEIISGITQKVGAATGILTSALTTITSMVLFVAIMMTLLALDPLIAILSALSFGVAYGIIAGSTRSRLNRNSKSAANDQTRVIKVLQEGLGAIRDVLLDGVQRVYCEVYSKAVFSLQRAVVENTFINQSPRFVMEVFGMVLIAVFVLVINNRSGNLGAVLPVLGMFALGAQRLLPLMQQIYGSWSGIIANKTALIEVIALLDQPMPLHAYQSEPDSLEFHDEICFDKVSFRYTNTAPFALNEIILNIPKGSRVGFMGTTGSGKSTLIDLLIGLLEPTYGQILVDGQPITRELLRSWQRSIAHVPQNIFLSDSTLEENIAFGVPKDRIDHERVLLAARQAQIADMIETWPKKYQTIVGERGIRLSGGQRQRIGIARALYKQANVIIFDEATSALDNETEQAVMQAIESLSNNLTIFIIAHRLTTLRNCTQIIEISNGRIKRIGSYKDIVSNMVNFNQ